MNVWLIIRSQQSTSISIVVLAIAIIKCYDPTYPFYGWRSWSLKTNCDLSLSLCVGYLPFTPPITVFILLFPRSQTPCMTLTGPCVLSVPPTGRPRRRWGGEGEWGPGTTLFGTFPGFYHWLCVSTEDGRHSQSDWLYMTFSFRNPKTAPTSGPFRSTDGNKFSATSSELLKNCPFMKILYQIILFSVFLTDTDNSQWQTWKWSPRLLVLFFILTSRSFICSLNNCLLRTRPRARHRRYKNQQCMGAHYSEASCIAVHGVRKLSVERAR